MADEQADKKAAGKLSITVWFGLLIVMSLIAGGTGAGFGFYLTSRMTAAANEAKPAPEAASALHIVKANVRDLPPVITNLDQTSDTWIRLQAAIVFDPAKVEKPDVLASEVASDILGFMQTLSIAQISGASGLQHLREDLNDRAMIRSEGHVQELVIESLVLQ